MAAKWPPRSNSDQWTIVSVFSAIPASYGSLTATPNGVLFQGQYGDIASTARYLVGLNLPFVVHQPPELCEALLQLAEQMIRSATGPLPASDHGSSTASSQ